MPDFPIGAEVTEAQMTALFGEGRHPNAEQIETDARERGVTSAEVDASSRLGKPYLVYEAANMFQRRIAGAFRDHNTLQGLPAGTPVPEGVRAAIRTRIATTMFRETYDRDPAPTPENCPGTWPASRGSRRQRWPGTT